MSIVALIALIVHCNMAAQNAEVRILNKAATIPHTLRWQVLSLTPFLTTLPTKVRVVSLACVKNVWTLGVMTVASTSLLKRRNMTTMQHVKLLKVELSL